MPLVVKLITYGSCQKSSIPKVAEVHSEVEKRRQEGVEKKHEEGTFSLDPSVLVSIAAGIPNNRFGARALVPMCSNYQDPLASVPI